MILPADEGTHPFPEGLDLWNESLFFDWIARDGSVAGHCRLGMHPTQGHLWLWFYLLHDGHWLRLEHRDLPLDGRYGLEWSHEQKGLSFRRTVAEALKTNRLDVEGVGTWVDGPRAGEAVSVAVELTFEAAGPAHGMAEREIEWVDGKTYQAARYEQPCDVQGQVAVDGHAASFEGRGERDHSWGPRMWAMDWTFLVVADDAWRAQVTEVVLGAMPPIKVGYLQNDTMEPLEEVTFALAYGPEDEIHRPFSGSVRSSSATHHLAGEIVPITGVALDDSHCMPEGARSIYRRTLVQLKCADRPPMWGWMETHRVVEA
ncbi:MAG: DUF7065 domain-containing protein [Myxococcota bacterium]